MKTFVVYISFLGLKKTIHLAKNAQMTLLLIKKVTVSAKYSDFADIFLEKWANVLSEQIKANKDKIKLEEDK